MVIREKRISRKAFAGGIICFLIAVIMLFALAEAIQVSTAASNDQTVEIGIPVEEHPELFLPRSMPTHGEGKIAVFLIEFPDYKNDNPNATVDFYDKLYFSGGGIR